MTFLDANVFLRHLTGDDTKKALACRDLFLRIEAGSTQVRTSESVLAEVVYVLRSPRLYDVPADTVRDLLVPLLSMPALDLPHKRSMLGALDLMASEPALDFEDAVSVMHMRREGISEILSYDRDFDRVDGIDRVEP